MSGRTRLWLVVLTLLALGCQPASVAPPRIQPATVGTLAVAGREFRLRVPSGYDAARPAGLVVGLHGYTSNSGELDSYLGLSTETERRGLLLALPEGTRNLQVHGTGDSAVMFGGAGSPQRTDSYPSATDSAAEWARLDGCQADPQAGPSRALTTDGAETRVQVWSHCTGTAQVELWAIHDGGHVPPLRPDFAATILDWLDAHAR